MYSSGQDSARHLKRKALGSLLLISFSLWLLRWSTGPTSYYRLDAVIQFRTIVIYWTVLLSVAILASTIYRQLTNRNQIIYTHIFPRAGSFCKSISNYLLHFLHSADTVIGFICNSYYILFQWKLSSIKIIFKLVFKIVFNVENIC